MRHTRKNGCQKRLLSMLLAVVLILSLFSVGAFASDGEDELEFVTTNIDATQRQASGQSASPFTDVSDNDWFSDCVQYVCERGLFHGTSDTTFSPDDPMTRGMLTTVLYRAEGEPEISLQSVFTDVESGKWYTNSIAWAVEEGVVAGYGNGLFGPEDDLTREQLATMLWRYAGMPEVNEVLEGFKDAGEVSKDSQDAVKWAVERSIIQGKDNGTLDPQGNATRAETAAMLMRYFAVQSAGQISEQDTNQPVKELPVLVYASTATGFTETGVMEDTVSSLVHEGQIYYSLDDVAEILDAELTYVGQNGSDMYTAYSSTVTFTALLADGSRLYALGAPFNHVTYTEQGEDGIWTSYTADDTKGIAWGNEWFLTAGGIHAAFSDIVFAEDSAYLLDGGDGLEVLSQLNGEVLNSAQASLWMLYIMDRENYDLFMEQCQQVIAVTRNHAIATTGNELVAAYVYLGTPKVYIVKEEFSGSNRHKLKENAAMLAHEAVHIQECRNEEYQSVITQITCLMRLGAPKSYIQGLINTFMTQPKYQNGAREAQKLLDGAD